MESKKTRGRQKIRMRKIENQEDRYATFTKRRSGIYKKASELCTRCNVDIGIIIFSPTGKPYTFFHPNMDSIIDKFLYPSQQKSEVNRLVESHTRTKIDQLRQKLDVLSSQAEVETEKSGNKLDQQDFSDNWWEKSIEEYNKEEVATMKSLLENLQIQILKHIDELRNKGSASSSSSSIPIACPSGTYQANVAFPSPLLSQVNLQPNVIHLSGAAEDFHGYVGLPSASNVLHQPYAYASPHNAPYSFAGGIFGQKIVDPSYNYLGTDLNFPK